jgi:hypothetical protein
MWGLEFRVEGLGLRAKLSGLKVRVERSKAEGLGLRV